MGWRNILQAPQELKKFKEVVADNSKQVSQISQVLDSVESENKSIPDSYYVEFFEERAGIAEFDGCQSREEAESIAYKDTLSEWICNNPPAGYEITHCAYCNKAFDFKAGGYLSWGDVYCCHHSQDNEHLRPYLKSRSNEAKAYLKLTGIKQPIYEV